MGSWAFRKHSLSSSSAPGRSSDSQLKKARFARGPESNTVSRIQDSAWRIPDDQTTVVRVKFGMGWAKF